MLQTLSLVQLLVHGAPFIFVFGARCTTNTAALFK